MVLMGWPLIRIGRCRGAGCCARAASSRPQLQKAMPVAPAPLRKVLRVVISSPPVLLIRRRTGDQSSADRFLIFSSEIVKSLPAFDQEFLGILGHILGIE